MKILKLSLVLVALFSVSCASIVSKSKYDVTIKSSSAKKVEIIDRKGRTVDSGTTPFTAKLRSSAGFFRPAQYTLKTSSSKSYLDANVDMWIIGNLFNFSGLIGFAVDGATGAMWELDEEVYVR